MRRVAAVPAAVRGLVLLSGIALVLVPGAVHPAPVLITAAGVLAAVLAPRQVGSSLATAGFVIGWIAATGWATSQPVARTVIAAAMLYLLHLTTALAAGLPWDAQAEPAVLVHWARRSALPLVVAAALIVLDEALPQARGSAWIGFGGLVGVALLAAVGFAAVRRRSPRLGRIDGRARQG
jgi:hypothetical protein